MLQMSGSSHEHSSSVFRSSSIKRCTSENPYKYMTLSFQTYDIFHVHDMFHLHVPLDLVVEATCDPLSNRLRSVTY